MISAQQCRVCSADCAARGQGAGVSIQRATILLAMSRCWTTLANLTDRYDAIVKEECTVIRGPREGT
jgi:hypothetical protein